MKSIYDDVELQISEEVYKPAEDTFFLADNLEVVEGEDVLELGTGSGLLSILTARQGGTVVATDINEEALVCARQNAVLNGFEDRIEFRLGDLFDPIEDEKFDLIIFNPPYLPVPEDEPRWSALERAWDGGPDGRKVIDRFLEEAKDYLKPGGRLMFVQSSLTGFGETLKKLNECFEVEVKREKLSFESLFLFMSRLD
ncbi:MAG: HemK2/MTQ2 family protein methyltransferase [Candidatus Hadarchaeia archaeon]